MMMKILVLFLVLSSIGVRVLSPNPEKKNSRSGGGGEDVIVKEAHRVQPNIKKQEYERVVEEEEANDQKPISTDAESSPSWVLSQFQINNPFEMKQRGGFQTVSSNILGQGNSGDLSLSKACEMSKQVVGEGLDKANKDLTSYNKANHLVEEGAFEGAKEKIQWLKEAIRVAKEKILEDLSEGIGDVKEKTLSRGKWKVILDKAYYDLKGLVSEETAMKAKDEIMVSDKAHLFKEAAAGAKDTVVSRKAHEFKEAIEEAAVETTPKKVSDQAKEKQVMPETICRVSEQDSEKANEFKEAMKETAAPMGAPPEEKVSKGLFSKSKEKVLDYAHELEASSKENIETATKRAKRFLVVLKRLYFMIEIGLTDDRTAKVKITHFLLEGSRNVTSLFLCVYQASDETVNWSVGVLRLMGFATAYGSCVWVTFVSSYVLSGALPRQQYVMVQSKIYPVYFRIMAFTLGWSFLGHFLIRHHEKSSPSEKLFGYDLMASIGLVLINFFFLEQATKVMHDIMKWEKEEGRGIAAEPSYVGGSKMVGEVEAEGFETLVNGEVREADRAQHQAQLERLNKRLKKLNTLSAFCNILTLMVLTSHLASLSYCLYASCDHEDGLILLRSIG